MDIKKFKKPPMIMRPAPFWAINDRIIPREVSIQMDDMLSVGLGGGFFHSRAGLITEYMGKEWFASIEAALDTAKKKGGYLWLYDEDLWPSGNAGGQIAGMKDEYRETYIRAFFLRKGDTEIPLEEEEVIRYAYKIVKREKRVLDKFQKIALEDIDKEKGSERLIIIRGYGPRTTWWSGESNPNLLHPKAMREFIRLTHKKYYEKLGSEFGKTIPGIFTDEPNIYRSQGQFPWYEGVVTLYHKWTGRNLWNDIPFLFFDGDNSKHIRLLIHRAFLRQFLEAYSKPIYEWCEKHRLSYTGHYNAEDSFEGQITNHCGGVMAHYRYQHIPGIDHLFRQIDGVLLTCKQASSASRQLGIKTVLTEIFGVSRHTNTFEDFKWLGDFDLVHGVNFFCPHLAWYSAKGRRKRDFPPVWNYQQTYWKELPALNDYFTRVAVALTSGKPDTKILLLHSIESAIAERRIGVGCIKQTDDIPEYDIKEAEILDSAICKALEAILNTGYDCDLADESFIEDMGEVKGKKFIVEKMPYEIVVIPPSYTWREKTVALLEKFIINGGIVIVLGKPPEDIDGVQNKKRWREMLSFKNVSCLPNSVESIQNKITSLYPSTYSLRSLEGKYYTKTYLQHRIDGKDEIFFIVNSDKEDERHYTLDIANAGKRRLLKLDAVNGEAYLADTKKEKDKLVYKFSLPPAGSLLLMLSATLGNFKKDRISPDIRMAEVVSLPPSFESERRDANVLVLDRISVSYDGNTFEKENTDWRVRKSIAERFGLQDAVRWQPWVSNKKGIFKGKGGKIVLRYKFFSDVERPNSYLVIEDIQKGRVFINGIEVPTDDKNMGWHWDRSFKKVAITKYVKKGENIVDFTVAYDVASEIEPIYIVGDFGVEIVNLYKGKIVKEKNTLKNGSLTGQGYPFYSGRMIYKSMFNFTGGKKRVFLKIINPSGTLFKIKINGKNAGNILWSPYMLEITPFIKKGKNNISVELVSSLQNSWGPLHEKEGDDNRWCGPHAFEDESFVREELSLFNYGIGGLEILSV